MKQNNIPDANIYLWSFEKDTLMYFDFEKGLNDQDEMTLDTESQEFKTAYERFFVELYWSTKEINLNDFIKRSRIDIGKQISGRYPGVHYWEHDDPRLLVCEAYLLPNSFIEKAKNEKNNLLKNNQRNKGFYLPSDTTDEKKSSSVSATSTSGECLVVSMFFNIDKGVLVYDSYPRGEIYSKLISVKIPSHFFVTKVIWALNNLKLYISFKISV